MKNLKNKRRVINVVVAFLVILGVGAGFATVPGTLDVVGRVHLAAEEYVVWSRVDVDSLNSEGLIAPLGWHIIDGATQEAEIVDGDDRTSQRIEWNVYFAEAGSVGLSAYVKNQSTVPAIITHVDYEWVFELNDLNFEDFGLEVFIDDFFMGPSFPLAPGVEHIHPILVAVVWDGTFPNADQEDIDDLWVVEGPITEDEYLFVGTLVIEFAYVPAP